MTNTEARKQAVRDAIEESRQRLLVASQSQLFVMPSAIQLPGVAEAFLTRPNQPQLSKEK